MAKWGLVIKKSNSKAHLARIERESERWKVFLLQMAMGVTSLSFQFTSQFIRDCKPKRDCWSWPAPAGDRAEGPRSRETWKCGWHRRDRLFPSTKPKWRDCTAVPLRRTRAVPRILPWIQFEQGATALPNTDGLATKLRPSANRAWPSIPRRKPVEWAAVAMPWSTLLPVSI